LPLARLCLVATFLLALTGSALAADAFDARRDLYLKSYLARPLKQGPNPTSWVDSERWCVAHACLEAGMRLDEANKYFENVEWASLWHGLVADSDVQVTDLIWTYLRFGKTDKLTPAAKAHLKQMFVEWKVPNYDRNRRADLEYEWPAEYTENHSLNIIAAAYLIDVILERPRDLRVNLLKRFFADRAKWAWSEFHSPSYAVVTAKVLGLLAATAPVRAVADAARMHLDVLALEFAATGLRHWRGVPYARGYGSETNNAANSMYEVARFWFDENVDKELHGSDMMLHLITDGYRPPAVARRLAMNLEARGRYEFNQTATHGVAKQRVPIAMWVTPTVTMASAQGEGSYYDGSFCSISFASAPNRVVIARDGKRRNIFQWRNALATFGDVKWYGDLKPVTEVAITIGGDDKAWIGQIKLDAKCHILMIGEKADYPDSAAFATALQALNASFVDGVVTWKTPDGAVIKMANERIGGLWKQSGVWVNDTPYRLDRNMLYDSPHLRSVRDSSVIEVQDGPRKITYDFRDMDAPKIVEEAKGTLTAIPAERIEGPLGIALRYIPAGEFPMGSPATEGHANERPQHWMTLGGYYMGETEITVGQYKQYLAKNPDVKPPPDWYEPEWGKTDAHPMTWVSWEDATAFCAWLSKTSGRKFMLPSEAQWEKAATGFTHQAYPWGNEYDGTQSGTPNGTYAPAGAHPIDVSPFGIRGMAGNAWEWCGDPYAASRYSPLRPANDILEGMRVLRGCGWNFDPDTFRNSYRTYFGQTERSVHIGFRILMMP